MGNAAREMSPLNEGKVKSGKGKAGLRAELKTGLKIRCVGIFDTWGIRGRAVACESGRTQMRPCSMRLNLTDGTRQTAHRLRFSAHEQVHPFRVYEHQRDIDDQEKRQDGEGRIRGDKAENGW